MNPKGKFQEALKLFDNKDYKGAKKGCDKILEKSPTNEEALALKGLSMYYLNEKEEGKKTLKNAITTNFKSATAWHFYALLYKEECDYPQAVKCYRCALKYDPNNYNIIRDLSYLQLYLRQLNSFTDYSKKAVDCRPGMMINWVTYAFAHSLIGNYEAASKLIESTHKIGENNIKKNERHELLVFDAMLKNKLGKYEEALNYLIKNKDEIIDKTLLYEKIIENALLSKKYDVGIEYCFKALDINCENINYFIWLFVMKVNSDDFKIKTYDDLLSLGEKNTHLPKLFDIVTKELKVKYPKSKIITRLELGLSTGEQFKEIFEKYFLKNVQITIPSFFINVKFIYQFQKYKIKIIEEILSKYLKNIETNGKITDNLDITANIVWAYFYTAQHYDFLGDEEAALKYINKAIDLTPTVVEFYMIKSKILKHSFMLEESALAYEKAKKLDLGDRYLNAKYAKIFVRMGDVSKSVEIMKEFVKEPLSEENVDYYHCKWFEAECGNAFLENGKYLHSHSLFKAILQHYVSIVEDQADFYNFCLRRYMISDLYKTIFYLDKITKNKYVYYAITKLDLIHSIIKSGVKEIDKDLTKEFEEMKNEGYIKYKYEKVDTLLEDIENDIYKTLKKLQGICNNDMIHFYCVKYFLIKNKVIMAIKSMKYLIKKSKTFAYFAARKIFDEFYEKNKDKFNEIYSDSVKEILSSEKNPKWEDQNNLMTTLYKMYLKGVFKNSEENGSLVKELLNYGDKFYYRTQKNENLNEVLVWLSLFIDSKEKEAFKKDLLEKMKINCTKEEITSNLIFWEKKEDFPGAVGKEKCDKKKEN